MTVKKSGAMGKPAKRNPLYVKIGKRIRQARLMAKETNSRTLSRHLEWSEGRINNFETGISTPGVEEALQFCEAVGADLCWITYGVGSPRASSVQTTRYRNLMAIFDEAESAGELLEVLEAMKFTLERLASFRANPFKTIPDRMARRCEKHLGKPKGWMDESHIGKGLYEPLPTDMRELLTIYSRLNEEDRRKLFAMSKVFLGEEFKET